MGGFATVNGLAFDPNTNTLYGVDTVTAQLIIISQVNGVGALVGPTGDTMRGLAFIP